MENGSQHWSLVRSPFCYCLHSSWCSSACKGCDSRETIMLQPIQRREFLRCCAAGLAAGSLLPRSLALAAHANDAQILAPKAGHFPAKAKHLIAVFLSGGVSHLDTFDYKPKLKADHGKVVPSVDLLGNAR